MNEFDDLLACIEIAVVVAWPSPRGTAYIHVLYYSIQNIDTTEYECAIVMQMFRQSCWTT